MNAMTIASAKEFAADGILVNAITPGSIDTPLTNSFDETQKEEFRQAGPLRRQGTRVKLWMPSGTPPLNKPSKQEAQLWVNVR